MEQQLSFCTTKDDVKLAYATSGKGAPIVRVAGWLTHLDLDWKGPIWSHWFREFSKNNTLIRYDHRGSGLSDSPVDAQSIENWVADLETIVDDLGVDEFPLLGYCQGGAIALSYAARHPEKVSKLILFGSYSQGGLAKGAPEERIKEVEALSQLIDVGWGRDDTEAFHKVFADLLIPEGSKEEQNWLAELQRRTASPEMAVRLWEAFHEIDVVEIAQKISIPTLIFHVTDDKMIPFEEGRKLASLIPDSRFVPLESTNHIVLKNDPAWVRFLAETRSFLNTSGSEEELNKSESTFPELTQRECEVLQLIAKGLKNDRIADQLNISSKTVRNHNTRIFSKLQVDSRGKAIILAREAGFGKD